MAIQRNKVAKVTRAIARARGTDVSITQAGEHLNGDETFPSDVLEDTEREGIRLSFLIHDVSRMRRSAYDQFMKPLGITRAQWWVLAHLSRHDGMMQTQLADILEVGKASLGDVVESLEASNLVSRRPDPSDKRAKRVYLTRSAQSLIKRMTVMEVDFNDQVFAELSSEERVSLSKLLLRIKSAVLRMTVSAKASA